jgi:hypothetical protein
MFRLGLATVGLALLSGVAAAAAGKNRPLPIAGVTTLGAEAAF